MCERACVRACVRARVRACVRVFHLEKSLNIAWNNREQPLKTTAATTKTLYLKNNNILPEHKKWRNCWIFCFELLTYELSSLGGKKRSLTIV